MNQIKFSLLVIVAALLAGNALFAQSVEQGKKFYYYQRYKSAREQFEKVLASNPNNVEATYWLGETMIDDKDSASAKALFQKALAANPNAPLLLVGTGHIELLDGKINEARQHFETAISLSKGRDVNVLNAIGIANDQAKNGDANYAIEKLTQATQVKNFNNNIHTYIYLGDAYRKLVDGTEAAKAYINAMRLDATSAEPKYKLGMLYRTQGDPTVYLPYFSEALQADSTYSPALYEMYYYWYNLDINKAADYFDKYLAYSDHTASDEYDRISIIYARAKYQDAITAAQQKLSADPNADPRFYKLIAYSYDALNDSVNAKNYLDLYFGKQKPAGFVPKDYVFRAQLLGKFPGNEDSIAVYFNQAIASDTVKANQIGYANMAAQVMGKAKKYQQQIVWMSKAIALKGEKTSEVEYYNFSKAVADALLGLHDSVEVKQLYLVGDSITNQYITDFPDKPQGYSFRVLIAKRSDKDTSQGLAIAPMQQQNMFLQKTLETSKRTIYNNYYYLLIYYTSYVKDMSRADAYKKAIEVTDQMIGLYPDAASEENQFAVRTKTQLQNALAKSQKTVSQQPTKSTSSARPSTGAAKK